MVNMDFVSDNITIIIEEIINVQNIAKYLYYTEKNSLSQPNVIPNDLVLTSVFPYPFDPTVVTVDCSQLMIYYPKADFTVDSVIAQMPVFFDIVVAKTLWLINDGKPAIRPYMIAKEIMNHFHDKSIATVGRLKFHGFVHLNVNPKFDAIRLIGETYLVGG